MPKAERSRDCLGHMPHMPPCTVHAVSMHCPDSTAQQHAVPSGPAPCVLPRAIMTTLRRFTCNDLLTFNNVNLDILTETYNLSFYLHYLSIWPEYCQVAEGPGRQTMGYVLGKAEGEGDKWHGHVTAVTVAPDYRRQHLAQKLMNVLEEVTEKVHNGYFVDLFVRKSNHIAIGMYERFGYIKYREVLGYYSGEENAYDMRKAMPRDVHKKSVVPLTRPVKPEELEFD